MDKYSNILCSIILSIAFLGGCYIIFLSQEDGSEIREAANADGSTNQTVLSHNKTILTESELAQYLGITAQEVTYLISLDTAKRKQYSGGIYDTYSFMPYMKLPNGTHIFLKSEIEEWVRYQSRAFKGG